MPLHFKAHAITKEKSVGCDMIEYYVLCECLAMQTTIVTLEKNG